MGHQLLSSFPFDLSFCISTVFSLVIHCGFSASRQALRCHTSFLCKPVKFFNQNPQTPSRPRAFQFGIFFNIIFSFPSKICTCASLFFLSIYFLISLNYAESLLCFISGPQISVQNVFASCASGITISSPSSLPSICL